MSQRAALKETLFYILGITLILAFVILYFSRFLFRTSMPPLIQSLFYGKGRAWAIAANAGVFILYLAFLPYRRGIAWRSKGAFSAFILALMAEMFGIPLMLYIVSPLLPALFPDRTLRLSVYGRLVEPGLRFLGGAGLIVGAWLTLFGMLLVIAGWKKVHAAQGLVTTGIYRWMRHPQYTGLFLILTGWILHWPTILTVLMYPILIFAYVRLALREEKDMLAEHGTAYLEYRRATPMFFPNPFRYRFLQGALHDLDQTDHRLG